MKKALLASILALGLAGCVSVGNWQALQGSGHVISEDRAVSQFNSVFVIGSGELELIQGTTEALTIVADDNLLPHIRTDVANGHLTLGPQGVNVRPTKTIHYRLLVKDLNGVRLSGSLNAQAAELKTSDLELAISGSGNIRIGHLDAQKVTTHITGSGDVSLAGKADAQEIHISGSGSLKTGDLPCRQADVYISGSGDALLWVKDRLAASIAGSGTVSYYGHPNSEVHTAGSGRVHGLGDK